MADSVNITIRVTDDEVAPKLRQVRSEIEKAFKGVEGGGVDSALVKAKRNLLDTVSQFQKLRPAAAEGGNGARELIEGFHGLSPILERVGLGVSNLRGFSVAASAGFAGLGAVVGGSILLGLIKIGDSAKETNARFNRLLGDTLGPKAVERVRQIAKDLGTSAETLTAPIETITQAERLRGGVQSSLERKATATATLERYGQAEGRAPGEGAKAAQELFESFAKQGEEHPGQPQFLTSAAVTSLAKSFGPVADQLARGLGAKSAAGLAAQIDLPGGPRFNLDQVLGAITPNAADAQKRLAALPPSQRTASAGFGQISREIQRPP